MDLKKNFDSIMDEEHMKYITTIFREKKPMIQKNETINIFLF